MLRTGMTVMWRTDIKPVASIPGIALQQTGIRVHNEVQWSRIMRLDSGVEYHSKRQRAN